MDYLSFFFMLVFLCYVFFYCPLLLVSVYYAASVTGHLVVDSARQYAIIQLNRILLIIKCIFITNQSV